MKLIVNSDVKYLVYSVLLSNIQMFVCSLTSLQEEQGYINAAI